MLPSKQTYRSQICPYGLYAEQLSGTAFTVPRKWVISLLQLKHVPHVRVCLSCLPISRDVGLVL